MSLTKTTIITTIGIFLSCLSVRPSLLIVLLLTVTTFLVMWVWGQSDCMSLLWPYSYNQIKTNTESSTDTLTSLWTVLRRNTESSTRTTVWTTKARYRLHRTLLIYHVTILNMNGFQWRSVYRDNIWSVYIITLYIFMSSYNILMYVSISVVMKPLATYS